MLFDFNQLSAQHAYKLLTSTVTPRPIAWVTSSSACGVLNAAPFSFFNVMGNNPPTVAIGLVPGVGGELKDTASNILATGEFVVNLVSADLVLEMNQTSAPYTSDVNELREVGLETIPASFVAPPLIKKSPVSMECISQTTVVTGPNQLVVIGRVVAMHVQDQYVLDAELAKIDTEQLHLVSRLHGASWYGKNIEQFEVERPTLAIKKH